MSEVDKSVSSSGEDSKNNTKRGNYASWTHDANEAGKTSLDTIVDWLVIGENYAKYKGSFKIPGGSNKKTAYCKNIADILVETGHLKRDFKGIMSQISELENKFKLAMKYLKNQSEQMPNLDIYGDHEETFIDAKGRKKILKEVVLKKFKYFYVLRPVLLKWEIANPEGSSNGTPQPVAGSPNSSKRQRGVGEHEEHFYDAPDTVIREDSHGEFSSFQVHTLAPATSSSSHPVINLENGNQGNNNYHTSYTNHRSLQAPPPLQPHPPHHPPLLLKPQPQPQPQPLLQPHPHPHPHPQLQPHPQQLQQLQQLQQPQQPQSQSQSQSQEPQSQSQHQRKKQKKQQSRDQVNELVRILLQEQKESIVTNRSSQDEKLELEKEKVLLEKQRLALEERRVALEERKENRIAFLSALEKLDKDNALYKTSLEKYIQKQISENDL